MFSRNFKQIYFSLLILLAITIGLQIFIYKIVIGALILHFLLTSDFQNKLKKITKSRFALLLIMFYLFYALSLLWSDNYAYAITDLILKLPIIILPVVIISNEKLSAKEINIIFFSFSISIFFLNLYCLFDASMSFMNTFNINEFFYSLLTVHMHTAYQSTLTCFSIVIFVYHLLKQSYLKKSLLYFLILFQIMIVLLLSSRMQIISMGVIIPVFLISFFYSKGKMYLGLVYTSLIFILAFIFTSFPSVLNYRYNQTISHIKSEGIDNKNSDARVFIWKEAIKVLNNNWLLGVGSGDAKDVLLSRYSKLIVNNPIADNLVDSVVQVIAENSDTNFFTKNDSAKFISNSKNQLRIQAENILIINNNRYKIFLKKRLNFHNQFLQTFGTIGLLGFIILICLFANLSYLAIIKRDFLVISFLFILFTSFLTESMLERQAGVILFSFFYVISVMRFSSNTLS